MHDLIQEMGKEIVRQESKRPSDRSRLWNHEDIYQVFKENTVRCICITFIFYLLCVSFRLNTSAAP